MCWPRKPGVSVPRRASLPSSDVTITSIGDSDTRVHRATSSKTRDPGFKTLQRCDAASKAIFALLPEWQLSSPATSGLNLSLSQMLPFQHAGCSFLTLPARLCTQLPWSVRLLFRVLNSISVFLCLCLSYCLVPAVLLGQSVATASYCPAQNIAFRDEMRACP